MPGVAGKKVLLIHEEQTVQRALQAIFKSHGYQVFYAAESKEGLRRLLNVQPDIAILSVTLPTLDGYAVAQRIRQCCDVPILLLVAPEEPGDTQRFATGDANAVLTWPVQPQIILTTIYSLLNPFSSNSDARGASQGEGEPDNLVVDSAQHRVFARGAFVKLTGLEYRLLTFFLQNIGRILTINQILQNVWGPDHLGRDQYVHTYVWRLRHKIEVDPKHPRYLLNEYNTGFYFAQP